MIADRDYANRYDLIWVRAANDERERLAQFDRFARELVQPVRRRRKPRVRPESKAARARYHLLIDIAFTAQRALAKELRESREYVAQECAPWFEKQKPCARCNGTGIFEPASWLGKIAACGCGTPIDEAFAATLQPVPCKAAA